jgi:hypothetical protein
MRHKRTSGRKRFTEESPRLLRRTGWAELSEEGRRRAQAEDEEANRRAEALVSLVRLRRAPCKGPEKLREEHAALLAKMSVLLKQAEDGKRDLTPRETRKWDSMEAKLVARKADIAVHVEIDRLASALRDPLQRIDSTRWRCSRAAVRRKIAEELFNCFVLEIRHARHWWDGVRSLQTERDAYLKAARIIAKLPRISHEAEAAFRFHRGVPAPADLKHQALLLNGRVNWFLQVRPRPLYHHTARYLDRLTLRLAAILTHTTDLTTHYALGEILPCVLDAAWQFYPDLAPRRGAGDPLTRYKRDMSMSKKDAARPVEQRIYLDPRATLKLAENRFLEYRKLLFKNDDRFPVSLFQPHRSIRTVDRMAPTKTR